MALSWPAGSEDGWYLSWGVCVPLSHLREWHCAFSTGEWASSAQPSTFPATALEHCGQGQVFLFLITLFSQWHPIALTWNLGHKDFGERWGKHAEIDLRSPLLHTPMAAALGPAGRCFNLWCLKQVYFSLNTGNNQSSYHCCLFKPLNNLMLCLLLVPIQLSPGLCGEILLNALFISLVLFPLYVWC